MPDVALEGGPLDGTTFAVPDAEWPMRMLRFDEGTYYADADTLTATFVDPAVGLPGEESGFDPLEYVPGPPGDQGPPGPAGADGAAGPAGADAVAIGLTYAGTWTPEGSYDAYDHVVLDGSSYYTAEPVEAGGDPPPTAPWVLLAAAGADGDGGGGTAGAMVWEGVWSAGAYVAGAVVKHADHVWVALVDTSAEPAEGGGGATPGYEDPPTALSGSMASHWLVPDDPLTVTVDGGDGSSAYWTGGGPGEYVAFDCQPSSSFSLLMEQIGGSGNVQVHVGRTSPAADGDGFATSRNVPASGSNTYTNSEAGNDARYVFVVNGVGVIRFTLTVTSGSSLPSSLGGGGGDPEWEIIV